MKFFPLLRYNFHSPLSENEIRNRLNCLTRAGNAFRVKYYPDIKISKYDGDVYENKFDISRTIAYRNSFLPVIKGKFQTSSKGTTISVAMRLNLFSIIFAIVWFGSLSAVLISGLCGGHISKIKFPLAFMLFGYLLFTIPFLIEARIARQDLERLFECGAGSTSI